MDVQTYPVIDLTPQGIGAESLGDRVNPTKLADDLVPIRDAFLRVLGGQQASTGGGIGLQTVEVSLTLTAEGNLGFVKGSAEGSITLSFGRPEAG